ncbi:MAG: DNA-binding protein [Spirochaetes bacterium]|nr:DNA-binding protein [Spirochaetota bacterium]
MFDPDIYKLYEEKEEQVFAFRCPSCKKVHYPAPMICDKCNTRRDPSNVYFSEWEKIPLQGECTLLSWTKVYALPEGYEVPYLLFGIVEFQNKIRASGRLSIERPETGMKLNARVDVVKKRGDKEIHGLIFS